MSNQIVSAVTVTAVIGALMLALMYYGASGPVDPNMQVTCRSGGGGQIVKIADQDCTFIARTLAEEARQSPTNTQAPSNATVAALGGVVSPEIILKPLPQAVTERVKSVAHYQYFIEGNDIALVDPQDRRVVAKIDVQQSKTP
jgi:hypothetical protein